MFSNNSRFDLSTTLIHFFRSIDEQSDNCPRLPEMFGWDAIDIRDYPLSPFFLMRNAVRYGKLWAGWSHRKGNHTIYGNDSAVCFTEMPIAAFIEAGLARSKKSQAMSPYGLVFDRNALTKLGARKAIYGIDDIPRITTDEHGRRFIDPIQLPLLEQYRYVAHNPSGENAIDWTHEREWRWPLRNGQLYESDKALEMSELEGLNFDTNILHGIGIILKTEKQKEQIQRDILMKYDRNDVNIGHFSYILTVNDINQDLNLQHKETLQELINSSKIDLQQYLRRPSEDQVNRVFGVANKIANKIKNENKINFNEEPGGCWLWLTDNLHHVTRCFVGTHYLQVTENGKYLIYVPHFSDYRNLRQKEDLIQQLAEQLTAELGITCGFFSVERSYNPNKVPFHLGTHETSHYMNISNRPEDY
ncbi:DUF4427 domain-containing protein [Pseudomonas lurida]|uniref:DUF4427 domain-containing protein n=1 Tax=Pseudomonas lurida TaxID=244566 RepID=UPI0034D97773